MAILWQVNLFVGFHIICPHCNDRFHRGHLNDCCPYYGPLIQAGAPLVAAHHDTYENLPNSYNEIDALLNAQAFSEVDRIFTHMDVHLCHLSRVPRAARASYINRLGQDAPLFWVLASVLTPTAGYSRPGFVSNDMNQSLIRLQFSRAAINDSIGMAIRNRIPPIPILTPPAFSLPKVLSAADPFSFETILFPPFPLSFLMEDMISRRWVRRMLWLDYLTLDVGITFYETKSKHHGQDENLWKTSTASSFNILSQYPDLFIIPTARDLTQAVPKVNSYWIAVGVAPQGAVNYNNAYAITSWNQVCQGNSYLRSGSTGYWMNGNEIECRLICHPGSAQDNSLPFC
ncbi:hypothetical protein PROFUN_09435 [Planoprotostelium fungivorum]|uniref:Uncharacterized protein n=1 Tax=Planoprotostelium fungivorum TaxID=1890364 RepID=A0A2P6NHI9_9EUKA|nr:hypothetical protein PROFUN_09435 [Planoprotostelium fungivorum]